VRHFSGQQLLDIRTRLELSREQLGVMAGSSGSSIARYERGEIVPSVDAAVSIAQALGVPVTSLLTETVRPAGEPRNIAELPPWAQRMIHDLRDGRKRGARTPRPRAQSVSVA
jgi:transcriptional regulator with XRE-family HTH domain